MADHPPTFTPEAVRRHVALLLGDYGRRVNGAALAADMLDQFAALLEATAWRDIGSAPKDGTFVLLHPSKCWAADVNADCEVGYWDKDVGGWISMGPTAEDYTGPTHWLPLPPAPKEA